MSAVLERRCRIVSRVTRCSTRMMDPVAVMMAMLVWLLYRMVC